MNEYIEKAMWGHSMKIDDLGLGLKFIPNADVKNLFPKEDPKREYMNWRRNR